MCTAEIPMVESVLEAIQKVSGCGSKEHPIPLHEPDFSGTEAWKYVKDCLDTGWVSSAGSWVSRFEQQLCTITGASNAIAVSNGTVALRLALHVIGVEACDEVMVPPLSFVATANAVAQLGAVPHFIDVEANSLGMCAEALSERLDRVAELRDNKVVNKETGRRISAVLPVHVFGNPANVEGIRDVAGKWGIPMVEDAAEALGSWRGETHCGLFGTMGTLSFNGNKLITTGGGGALITNNKNLARRAKHLSTTAKKSHPWSFDHDAIAWNDRLPNVNAALGVAQLEDINRRLEAKRNIAQQYKEEFNNLEGVELLKEQKGCRSNNWMVSLRFTATNPQKAGSHKLELLKRAHMTGLLLRPIWTPLHKLPMYETCPKGILKVAENEAPRLVNLPSSPQLWENWQTSNSNC